jgi:hypothetical protein
LGIYPAPNNTGDGRPSIVAWNEGDWLEITNAHLEMTSATLNTTTDPVSGIFHGSLPDTATDDYAWTGTPDASASTRTTVSYRENIFPNPKAAIDYGYGMWAGTGGAATYSLRTGQSGWALGTSTAFRVTWTQAVTPNNSAGIYAVTPITPGAKRYAVFGQARTSKAQRMMLGVEFHNSTTGWISSAPAQELAVAANTVTNFFVSGDSPPANADRIVFTLYSWAQGGPPYADWQPGDWLEATNFQIETTAATLTADTNPATGIFHGDLADTKAVEYAWTGTANQSSSRRYEPPRLLWDTATCFGGPLPSSGRWADVSASTRWNDVAATVTWDTWT